MRWTVLVLVACASPRWERDRVRVDIRGGGPPGATEATGRAVETWAAALSEYGVALVVASPGEIVVEWVETATARWSHSFGTTVINWDPVAGGASAAHVSLRMDAPWSDVCVGVALDIEAAVAHEMGHALGLGHVDVAGATMQNAFEWCDVEKRDLSRADLVALAEIY
jgi:predicted Zn-dependent protease